MRRRRSPSGRGAVVRRGGGVTLIELLLALSVVAIIGVIATTMFFTMSSGTASGRDSRARNLRSEVLCARVDARVRSAARVLAADGRSLVLWMGDERPNGIPEASELCRIEWDADSGVVRAYAAPADLAPADDATYPIASTDFAAVSRELAADGVLEPAVLGRGVRNWAVDPAGGAPPQAWRSVTYRVGLEGQPGADHVGVVALRGN